MDIFIFFINFADIFKIYIFNMAIIKTVEGENSSMGKEKPDRYIQDGILIAIDTDKEYLSDNMAFMNKDI